MSRRSRTSSSPKGIRPQTRTSKAHATHSGSTGPRRRQVLPLRWLARVAHAAGLGSSSAASPTAHAGITQPVTPRCVGVSDAQSGRRGSPRGCPARRPSGRPQGTPLRGHASPVAHAAGSMGNFIRGRSQPASRELKAPTLTPDRHARRAQRGPPNSEHRPHPHAPNHEVGAVREPPYAAMPDWRSPPDRMFGSGRGPIHHAVPH